MSRPIPVAPLAGRPASSAALALALTFLSALACAAQVTPEAPPPVDSAEKRAVVERLADVIEARYVFPDVARVIGDTLRTRLAAGAFDQPADPEAFAREVSGIIRDVSGDGHLWITVHEGEIRPPRGPSSPEELEARRRRLARTNFGFAAAEILPGNVGYLALRQFVDPELAGGAAAAAMHFLANTDALIIDLRRNAGGSSEMVRLLASYLLGPEPVHLFDRYLRPDDVIEAHWTLAELPGPPLDRQPVYLLVHRRTFSAPEALAYLLKHQGRVTIVGERTAGGANPGALHPIGDRFAAFVAEGQVTSPVTGDNWEGRGVAPHVEVEAEHALREAHRLALLAVLSGQTDESWREEVLAALEALANDSEPR